MKIDISDPNNVFPCYFQLKATQNTPSIKQLNDEVGKKDKPLEKIKHCFESVYITTAE
jgi:hypothetical protein